MESFSHEHQDIFAQIMNPDGGYFLDVACGHPQIGSNTYQLERRGWRGWCVDLRDCDSLGWSQYRTQPWHRFDATSDDFGNWVMDTVTEPISYLSLDVDSAGRNLALPALKQILKTNQIIYTATVEHEAYIHGTAIRDQIREQMEARGLQIMFGDVRLLGHKEGFEDWWAHPTIMPNPDFRMDGLTYPEAIAWLKDQFGINPKIRHHCSRARPNEYDLFWDEQEKQNLEEIFSQSR